MAKVDTNAVALNYAREAVAGVKAGAGWRGMEPNEISQFGAAITTTPREPISDKLQRRKGTPTDLDSSVAFSADITVDGLWDWLEAAIFALSINADVRDMPVTAVDAGDDAYTVAALNADQAAKLVESTLLWAHGFDVDANNGLKLLDDATAAAATEIGVTDGLADDGAGFVSLAGYRVAGAKTWAYTAATRTATLSVNGLGNILDDILKPGQTVHFGSVVSAGADAQNGLHTGGANTEERFGFARVRSIAANVITFDRVDEALQFTQAMADNANAADIIAGDFIRNVPRSDADYVQQAHTLEQVSPDLFPPAGAGMPLRAGYEYATGQVIGSLVLNFPLTDKATMTVNLIGEDVEKPNTARQAGAAAAVDPVRAEAFNTSADFARLRVTEVDDTGITTDFKSVTITINPQTSPEKILGKLGAGFINRGNMLVDVASQVIFSDAAVLAAIRDNETVRFDVIIGNNEGVFVFEVPSQTLGGGNREYPANQAVLVNTTGQSFEDADFETSIHVSYMPVPIPTE